MRSKKLLIVVYVGMKRVGDFASRYIRNVSENLQNSIWADDCNFLVVPRGDSEEITIECINPVLLTEDKYKEVEDTVNKLKEVLKEFKKDEK